MAQEVARRRPLRQRIGSTPEEKKAFRDAQIAWMQECRYEAGALLDDPEEAAIWERVNMTFVEASWIEVLHQFPNGKPLLAQDPRDLEYWRLAINAMHRYAERGHGGHGGD